jgi:hypothetical protein
VSAGDVLAGFGQGRMFSAQGAVAAGLADRVDTFASTVQGLLAAPPSSFGTQRADAAYERILSEAAIELETSPVDPAERPSGADKPAPVNGRVARSLSGR